MLVQVARLLRAYAASKIDLVDRHIVDQAFVLHRDGCGEGVQGGLDEVGQGEGRTFVAHGDVWRDQDNLAAIVEGGFAGDPEMVGQI